MMYLAALAFVVYFAAPQVERLLRPVKPFKNVTEGGIIEPP
jgi:hypothetical protein